MQNIVPEVVVAMELLFFLLVVLIRTLSILAAVGPQRVQHLEVEAGLLVPLGPEWMVALVLVPVALHDDLPQEPLEAVIVGLRD